MVTDENVLTSQEIRDNIKRRVIKLERQNYALKPEGLKDREMIERIRKIIESEVGK